MVRGGMTKVYIETYGCQMNFNDSEIVASILTRWGAQLVSNPDRADILLINTCAIREKAEERVRNRLKELARYKTQRAGVLIGVLGCMAERLRECLLEEEVVDIVCGPDAYRSLPALIEKAATGQKAVNVLLSREETYEDIEPVRLNSNGVSAFISIMRGCNNMCTFCVVPFTRGRERSRNPYTIIREAEHLYEQGYREITLLGQNVDSYRWIDPRTGKIVDFADLLDAVARVATDLRIRFSTSHPKDMSEKVLRVMQRHPNICRHIHLPVQSGSNRVLERMRRGYTREWYIELANKIRIAFGGDCTISTDIIAGFCGETEEDHKQTLDLMEKVRFDSAFMFRYSHRPNTYAYRKLRDDVPEEVKIRRLQEIITLQRELSLESNRKEIGKVREILIEGDASRTPHTHLMGRTSQNKVVVVRKQKGLAPGMYVEVKITDCTSATLFGEPVATKEIIPTHETHHA